MKKKHKLIPPTKDENVEINQGIAQDEDNPEWTDADFERAKPAQEALPEIMGKKNAEVLLQQGLKKSAFEKTKKPITINLDADVIQWLKDQGPGYQLKVNSILRHEMERH